MASYTRNVDDSGAAWWPALRQLSSSFNLAGQGWQTEPLV